MARRYLYIVMVLVVCSSFAWSWGGPTHIFINQHAAIHLPPGFPFFANNISWISTHAVDADNRKNSDPTEGTKHYIDIEDYPEFATRTLSHNYDTLVAKHSLYTVTNIGVVPWAIIWSLDSLTNCLKRGDSLRALQFAADLGHYVGDAHQPLHATTNYDGPNGTSDGIHSRYESTMLATYNYLNQVNVVARSVHYIPVPIDTNFAFIIHGNGLIDSIFRADTYAVSIDASHKGAYYAALWAKTGAMTQNQIQDATVDLASLWYTAAINAGIVSNTFTLNPMGASPKTIVCGSLNPGTSKDIPLTLVNNGTNALNISSIISLGNPFSVQAISASLMPGQSLIDTLRFSPMSSGLASGRVVIASDGASSSDTLLVSGIGTGYADLHLLTHSISFGNARVGQSKDTTFTITNTGDDTLKFSNVMTDSTVLSVKPSASSLPPGKSFTDTLSFTPSSVGPFQGTIIIVSNSATSPDTVKVDGIGQSVTGIPIASAGIPERFELSQNYPNPFNPSTLIRYALPFESMVRIRIFNVLGQLITEPVSAVQSPGYRQVVWNAMAPSGIYFCRIEAVSVANPTLRFVDVKKMLLLK